jgi:lactoylglutathione lyase
VVQSAFPIISTPDLPGALAFYVGLLGGTISYAFPAEGEPDYVGLELGSSHLGIGHDPDLAGEGIQRFSLWVYVDDCDEVVESMRVSGVPILEEAVDQPWGERIARVGDPDGNVVIIGARITPTD